MQKYLLSTHRIDDRSLRDFKLLSDIESGAHCALNPAYSGGNPLPLHFTDYSCQCLMSRHRSG
jgi:hypothetical protein